MKLVENEQYYYDAVAAEKPIKFIERYLRHIDDKWESKPFLLLEWQKQIIRDLFGWKRRADGLRRFKELYLEIAKGNGKSPILAAIGLYVCYVEGGAPLIQSAAGDYKQAAVTFELAKGMIEANPALNEHAEILQHAIKIPKVKAKWVIISGEDKAKSGPKPSVVILDELHEAKHRNLYYRLRRNALKRSQPLILVATNAGERKDSVCWELHERAAKVIKGDSRDDELYPVIYAAGDKDDPGAPATWNKANPALDEAAVTTEMLRAEWEKAKETPALEADFRRFHLSQWGHASQKWLDMAAWEDCLDKFDTETVKDMPCVLGWDGSLKDDLTALDLVWYSSEKIYVRSKFWLPRKTAYDYIDKAGIKYDEWAAKKHINLIDAETIDPATQQRIANFVLKLNTKYKIKAFCYDPAKASNIVALLEQAGVICVQVPQGFKLTAALEEIERRLKDRSIVISPNEVMNFCARNAEIEPGKYGGIRLVKGMSKGKYAGNKNFKIDGIQALATAMHQVLRELMQPAAKPSVYESRGVFVL